MNEKNIKSLIKKLDKEILRLRKSDVKKFPRSVGFKITKNMTMDDIPEDKVLLVHSMLHMFYHNKNGADLSPKSIEMLHKEVSKRMKNHFKFDGLDE